jgi:hypothetical protein
MKKLLRPYDVLGGTCLGAAPLVLAGAFTAVYAQSPSVVAIPASGPQTAVK